MRFRLSRDKLRSMPTAKSTAESLFESYLASRDLRADYEPKLGGKRPDYLVHAPGGDFVVEVEELQCPDPIPTQGYSPTTSIRESMRRARNQLRGCKHLPAAILVYSEAMYRSVTPTTVACAAFGPGYQDARRYDRVEPWSPALQFTKRHEWGTRLPKLANPFLSRAANTSISALLVLMRYRLSEFELAVWKELLARQASGEQLRPGASLDVAARLQHTVPRTYQFADTIRVVVIENPHRRIPFPTDVFCGPFDQHWKWQDEWCMPTWIGATAANCFQVGVPFDLL
jgi:hypothetical protein